MSIQPEDRNTLDMFATPAPGRPRSSLYDRKTQSRHHKRSQRQRDKAQGIQRVEVRLEGRVVEKLDKVCDQLNLSRTEVMECALKQWLHLD